MTIDSIVRDIIRKRASRSVAGEELRADVTLGADGLGLDSIAIAEVLLDCQQRFGVNVTSLLEGEPLTVRRLIAHLERETAA
jgi:acyl carrier protein